MKGQVRAKFRCMEVTDRKWDDQETVKFLAVHGNGDNEENKQFWEASPSGKMELTIKNPDSWGLFKSGSYYYLDFTLGDKPSEFEGDPIVATKWRVHRVARNWESSTEIGLSPLQGHWDKETRKTVPHPLNVVLWPDYPYGDFSVNIDYKAPAKNSFTEGEEWLFEIRDAPE